MNFFLPEKTTKHLIHFISSDIIKFTSQFRTFLSVLNLNGWSGRTRTIQRRDGRSWDVFQTHRMAMGAGHAEDPREVGGSHLEERGEGSSKERKGGTRCFVCSSWCVMGLVSMCFWATHSQFEEKTIKVINSERRCFICGSIELEVSKLFKEHPPCKTNFRCLFRAKWELDYSLDFSLW